MSASETLAKMALLEILIAVPLARSSHVFKIAAIIFASQCDPEGVIEVGRKWGTVASTLAEAQEALTETLASVTEEEWKARDREAFAELIDDVKGALKAMEFLAQALSIAMTVLGVLLFVLVGAMFGLASYLAILGIATLIPYTRPAATAQIKIVGPIGHQALKRLEAVIEQTGHAMAALVGAAAAVDIGIQIKHGNAKEVGKDAFAGVADSIDEMIAGTVSYLEVKGFSSLIKGGGGLALPALGAGAGLNVVPLPGPDGTAPPGQASAYGNDWIPNKGGWRDFNSVDTGRGWDDRPTPDQAPAE